MNTLLFLLATLGAFEDRLLDERHVWGPPAAVAAVTAGAACWGAAAACRHVRARVHSPVRTPVDTRPDTAPCGAVTCKDTCPDMSVGLCLDTSGHTPEGDPS
ncbi:hypothetical protein [Streptomyces sp. NPDC059063]|uniref:hypothetical protein n=1 Tax=Streptomyces sp. NPDC059063 TaxID=3346712 RepID=UPI0036AEA604